MKPEETVIKNILKKINSLVLNTGFSKYELGCELSIANRTINWRLTDYKGWSNFCAKNIKLSFTTVENYRLLAELVKEYGYTNLQVKRMIEGCGWNNFRVGISDQLKKNSVKDFISIYKNWGNDPENFNSSGDIHYHFSLNRADAKKLDYHLKVYGMHFTHKGVRSGLSSAMTTLIKRKLK